jgi:hypothetical protein
MPNALLVPSFRAITRPDADVENRLAVRSDSLQFRLDFRLSPRGGSPRRCKHFRNLCSRESAAAPTYTSMSARAHRTCVTTE